MEVNESAVLEALRATQLLAVKIFPGVTVGFFTSLLLANVNLLPPFNKLKPAGVRSIDASAAIAPGVITKASPAAAVIASLTPPSTAAKTAIFPASLIKKVESPETA